MLSAAENRRLTEVGPGTAMGSLLRRYWTPIAGEAELDDTPVKPIRLFGEDLVLYRDLGGRYGLLDRHCSHRRADLSYGFVEDTGIRCNYHGWRFDETGRCVERPFEEIANPDARIKDRCSVTAYPVRALAGLLWAYMGPAPAPELPVWDAFTWENGFAEVVVAEIPCNWLQCQENSNDPVHFEWMHDNWRVRLKGARGPYSPRHLKLDFEEFDYGFAYKRIRDGMTEADRLWTIGRVALWPIGFFLGEHFEWRVPIDDENTLSIGWFFTRVPKEREPYVQDRIPTWRGPLTDARGRWIDSHVMNQDFIAWVGQGRIADRTRENLAMSDRGVVMMRKQYAADLEAVAAGRDPKGIIRDPAAARCVVLPNANRATYVDGLTRAEMDVHPLFSRRFKGFLWQAGQPDEVWNAYAEAMGLGPDSRDPGEILRT